MVDAQLLSSTTPASRICPASAPTPTPTPTPNRMSCKAMSDPAEALLLTRLAHHRDRLQRQAVWVKSALSGDAHQDCLGEAAGIFVDASRQPWDHALRLDLTQLSLVRDLPGHRDAMAAGEVVNASEGRAAGHLRLRATDHELSRKGLDELVRTRRAFLEEAARLRIDPQVQHIVHVGIGGSDLGPRLLLSALGIRGTHLKIHFAGNGDLHELEGVLSSLHPAQCVVVLCSKSFSTQETLVNASRIRAWMDQADSSLFGQRTYAITSNPAAAQAFGVLRTFAFPDWVGGRYSLWSPIGLSAAVAIGPEAFEALLAGARAMDRHWLEAPPEQNLPWQLGLLDVWNRNDMGFASRCVVPYDSRLARLPAYLQQLEMESNGKSTDNHGRPVAQSTSPLIWGEPGTNAQHSFFQWLHQGSDVTPVEFILVQHPDHSNAEAHRKLLANALGQSWALLRGKTIREALGERVKGANPEWSAEQLAPHRVFAGARPSTLLMMDRLSPERLGALLALYEHRVFVAAHMWRINPFDQWGVELGKSLADDIDRRLASGSQEGCDPQTARWIRRLAGPGGAATQPTGAGSDLSE